MRRIDELADVIDRLTEAEGGQATAIGGLYLTKMSEPVAPRTSFDRAVFCVVAQGVKSVLLNGERYVYDPSTYLVVSHGLPLVGEVVTATPDRPFLGISMELDFAEVGALVLEPGIPVRAGSADHRGLFVSPLGDDLLDAVVRLVRLLFDPAQIAFMAPLVRREIFYRLLCGEHGGTLRALLVENSQAQRIAAGIEWLKLNATKTICMSDLAREVHMSPSSMHAWFKAVTTMSPLQFQKQLRLQEARRILLSEAADAATVSERVGYESPSQFSREYRRFFGLPPLRDIERLRRAGGVQPAALVPG